MLACLALRIFLFHLGLLSSHVLGFLHSTDNRVEVSSVDLKVQEEQLNAENMQVWTTVVCSSVRADIWHKSVEKRKLTLRQPQLCKY